MHSDFSELLYCIAMILVDDFELRTGTTVRLFRLGTMHNLLQPYRSPDNVRKKDYTTNCLDQENTLAELPGPILQFDFRLWKELMM